MRLRTYIINLEKSTVRNQYMLDLLSKYSFLDIKFIKAIDGRQLSEEERQSSFDLKGGLALYGKVLNAGEVGCALSHRKAYETLLMDNHPYALILEDDISIIRDLNALDTEAIDVLMNDKTPKAMMLSGDYWYYRRKPITRIFTAVGAYAYIINRAAAQRILSVSPPRCVADDWLFYKRKGLTLFAVYPYMIDANMNMALLGSDVKQDNWTIDRSKMSIKEILISAINSVIKICLKLIHHFEFKVRIYQNRIVAQQKNPFK